MAQDLLKISLEHHRAGRLVQAETGYRAVLSANPNDSDAMHWLGVLLYQAGQYSQALPLLESAATRRPLDAACQHNLGQAYLSAGQPDQAIVSFERALVAEPDGKESLVALSQARLSRGHRGDAQAAVLALRMAGGGHSDSPELLHHLGVALLAAGQPSEAIDACRAALTKKPSDAAIYYHLALAYRGKGDAKETRKSLIKALELEPTMAQGWCALAMLDAESGNHASAMGLFRRAIAANRNYVAAYEGLGRVLEQLGRSAESLAAFDQARRAAEDPPTSGPTRSTPSDSVAALQRHLTPTAEQAQAHFAMAALLNVFPPVQSPPESVAGLFDRYAPKFDRHLVDTLGYRIPEKLAEAVFPFCQGKLLDVLDAGCGTGLAAPLLRPMSRTLVGVDLSPAMIEKARERGLYDRLQVGDLVEFLQRAPAAYDLLICADVLIYLGEAAPFFQAASTALRPGGLLAFSIEAGTGDRYDLIPRSRRYTHSKAYIQHLTKIYGFVEKVFQTTVVRQESDRPVNGYLVVLATPGD